MEITRLETRGDALSIKTARQGRTRSIKEETHIGHTVEQREAFGRVWRDRLNLGILRSNARRILRHAKTSAKQRAVAEAFLATNSRNYGKIINSITKTMSRIYPDF
jgi:hypothetical protein